MGFSLALISCQDTGFHQQATATKPLSLVDHGKRLYQAQCSSCHHRDPHQDHVLGPAVAGSSFELLEARILRAEYPEGYQPKRSTKIMLRMPALKTQIEALYVYLNEVEERASR